MNRNVTRTAMIGAALAASLAAESPAAACLRTLEVRFEPDAAEIADREKVTEFLAVPAYGNGQLVSIRVAAPVHNLALRRARALSDLLQAHGQSPSGIKIETSRNAIERTTMVVYPPPTVRPDPRFAQAAPPTPAAPRRTCGG
jgi:hypothetical protein